MKVTSLYKKSIKKLLQGSIILVLTASFAMADPVVSNYLNPNWTDADKQHDQADWGWNYWDDWDNNGRWDPGEPFADSVDINWFNPKSDRDNSCWIASAANMLASAGYFNGDAQAIYWDIVYNMTTPWHTTLFGWQDGGWQHEALSWYLTYYWDPTLKSTISYYGVYYGRDGTNAQAWPTNAFDFAADSLASDDEVGIVIHSFSIYHAITFQGYDFDTMSMQITDSDQDASSNGLDTYNFNLTGTTGWYMTNYGSGIAIDYYAILHTVKKVPEPTTMLLFGSGLIGLLGLRRKKFFKK